MIGKRAEYRTRTGLFKNEYLEQLFAYFELHQYISAMFDPAKNHHIFVYGLLGWLYEHASEKVRNKFIIRHFILPFSNELTPSLKNHDIEAQCHVLSQVVYGCKVKLTVQKKRRKFSGNCYFR